MVPGHGPGTSAKCFALSATKNTPAEEPRLDQPTHPKVEHARDVSVRGVAAAIRTEKELIRRSKLYDEFAPKSRFK